MTDELIKREDMTPQIADSLELYPMLVDEEYNLTDYIKMPITQVTALGAAFEPITSAIQTVINGGGAQSGLYRVTIPQGTHLAEFKSGIGNLGAVLDADNKLAGQAVLNQLPCDPTMLFVAATMANIDKKLDAIQEQQREMMDFLKQKEKAVLRGDLKFLADLLKDYKFNWDNKQFKSSCHKKTLDIRQEAEKKIFFYRDQIISKIKKEQLIHLDSDVQKQIKTIQTDFREYQIALYLYSFATYADVLINGNYKSKYLAGIKQRIEDYSLEYQELYSQCYGRLEKYLGTSVQSKMLKGLRDASKAAGKAIARVPVINKGPADELLIKAGKELEYKRERRTLKQMNTLVQRRHSYVRSFVNDLESLEQLYNSPVELVFNNDTICLGVANENTI